MGKVTVNDHRDSIDSALGHSYLAAQEQAESFGSASPGDRSLPRDFGSLNYNLARTETGNERHPGTSSQDPEVWRFYVFVGERLRKNGSLGAQRDHADSGETLGGRAPGTGAAERQGGLGWDPHCPKPGTMLCVFLVFLSFRFLWRVRPGGRRWDSSDFVTAIVLRSGCTLVMKGRSRKLG